MNDATKLRVGVTGCTGVLGKILTFKLSKNNIDASCFAGDISNFDQVSKWISESNPERLIHFAALVPTDQVDSNPGRAIEVNVFGTSNLLRAIVDNKLSPWIFIASTSHVYASYDKNIREDSPLSPITNYGKTKLLSEQVAEFYGSVCELDICIGRIFSFYHESQKKPFLYPSIVERLRKHDPSKPFELRGDRNIRDISNAEEIVDKILQLFEIEFVGTANIGKGSGITIREFVESISDVPLKIIPFDDSKTTRLVADTGLFEKVTHEN